jgi:hypothetical protein
MKFAFGVAYVQNGFGCFMAWRGVSPASLVMPPSSEQKFRFQVDKLGSKGCGVSGVVRGSPS